jgi:hypothetical protein
MTESNAAVGTGTFTAAANSVRSRIKDTAAQTKLLVGEVKMRETNGVEDVGEMIANLMLCYRHLEDASMRLGKAIQAHDGGVSVYDKATTVGA